MKAAKIIFICSLLVLTVFSMACADVPVKPAGSDGEPDPGRCSMKPERGPCKALFEKFYFDEKNRECKTFPWGGCEGSVPFETRQACEDACMPPQTVRISKIRTLEGGVYAAVDLEFPKAWKDPKFTMSVNGKQVNIRHSSGGFSTDRNTAGFLFFPGKGGKKNLTVRCVVDGKRTEARSTFSWQPGAFLSLLQHKGDRELFFTKERLAVAAANVYDVNIVFNGRDVRPGKSGGDVSVFSFEPEWKQGRNTLAVSAKKQDGSIIAKNYTFFYLADGDSLAVGDTVLLQYGREGSKSGPFYDLKFEGVSVKPLKEGIVDNYTIDREGWLKKETRFTQEIKAERPGASKIQIFVKHHFLQNMELEKELVIVVKER